MPTVLFGVVGLAAWRAGARPSTTYLVVGGAVYLVLWLYGEVVDHHGSANFVPVNQADNWLHLGLGLGMVSMGLIARLRHRGTVTPDLA